MFSFSGLSASTIHVGIVSLYSDLLCICLVILLAIFEFLFTTISYYERYPYHYINTVDTWSDFKRDYFSIGLKRKVSPQDFLNVNLFSIQLSSRIESYLDTLFIVIPTTIIIYILFPTLGFLYFAELENSLDSSVLEINVIAHQWYWSYEYSNFSEYLEYDGVYNGEWGYKFDSIMCGGLLEVDTTLILPVHTSILLSITSEDVIHAFALPSFGIKVDAIPGRVTTVFINSFLEGSFSGQCSELCGVRHAFMPICIDFVSPDLFYAWETFHINDD